MPIKIIKKGIIITSRPSLSLDIFNRSVILIVEHSDNGSIGFILNKPTHIPVNIFTSQLESPQIVYEGGPVEKENIFYLHRRPDLIENSIYVKDDIYWGGEYNDVIYAIKNSLFKEDDIKFYLGYSGWSTSQLEDELINSNAWDIIENYDFDVFNTWENDLWQDSLKKLGGENLLWLNTPFDPSMN